MSNRYILIFGDPAINTGFVVELAGASRLKPFDPFRSVFETEIYHSTIFTQHYWLCHTAGIPSSRTARSSLRALDVGEPLFLNSHV
jgi:hypothetical protein